MDIARSLLFTRDLGTGSFGFVCVFRLLLCLLHRCLIGYRCGTWACRADLGSALLGWLAVSDYQDVAVFYYVVFALQAE